ncbi:MAG: glycosyltransferase family 39 protein [Solirubrobacterales bacterium]
MKKIKIKNMKKENYAIVLILAISAVLNITNLDIEGFANLYYAAGVKSMTMSWSNFFFVAFDPSGFVSIDKPPVGFWIQALSARIFGFNSWSILLPQAIAGVISVWVLYRVVRRSFGNVPALISSLILATTPVFVAVSRNNTIDNILVMILLFACWALSIAAENGRLKWLIICMVLIGVGFNVKMLQAYMILPAVYMVYLLPTSIPIKKRIIHLAAATVILVGISLSWACIVDMVPSSSRPFVGSSTNNSVIELVIGHNGLERLGLSSSNKDGGQKQTANTVESSISSTGDNMGQPGNNPGMQNGGTPPSGTPPTGDSGDMKHDEQMPPGTADGRDGNKGGMGGGTFGGTETSSVTRLFLNNSLSDQIIWMFPLAMFGLIAAALKEKMKFNMDNKKKQAILIFAAWLIPEFIYFSFTTGLFHPYYLTMMAAPIASLAGIGMVSMWELYKEKGWKSWILPLGFITTGAVQLLILSYSYSSAAMVKYIMAAVTILCFGSSAALIGIKFIKTTNISDRIKKSFIAAALAGLLIAPVIWSGAAMFYKSQGTFPAAGISLLTSKSGMGGMPSGDSTSTAKLVEYLKANRTTEKYLVAVPSSNSYGTEIILNYGETVMTLGGFSGSDNILTLDQFKQMVKDGQVRYAIIGGGGGGQGNSEIYSWIKSNGKAVSESTWSGTTTTEKTDSVQDFGGRNQVQLYDLKDSLK